MGMPYQGQQPAPQTYGNYGAYAQQPSLPVADMGNRSIAYVIDYAILVGLIVVLYVVSFLLIFLLKELGAILALLIFLLMFVISISYHPYFEATRGGQTPGKKMRGIKVVKEDGSPCDWGAAWMRRLGLFIDAIVFGFIPGYIIANGHPRHQRLGDQWARTVVINATATPVGGALRAPTAYPAPSPQYPAQPQVPQYQQSAVPLPPPSVTQPAAPPPAPPSAATQALPPLAPPSPDATPQADQLPQSVPPPPTAPSPTAQTQAINAADLNLEPQPGKEGQ